MNSAADINSRESESGIIATLIHHPDYIYYSEQLLPNHFTVKENACIYVAISNLAKQGIKNIDAYNIIEDLNSSEGTKKISEDITIDRLNELIEVSNILCRNTPNEYMMLVKNVMNAAFRRDAFVGLKECEQICCDMKAQDIEHKIYSTLDDIMLNYSKTNEIPEYKDVVDEYWEQIEARRNGQYSGILFPYKTLNRYTTMERGELVIFAADAKGGKSMMLLNIAMDLLRQNKSVLYIDSELNSRLFTVRVISNLTGIEFRRVRDGMYNDEEAEKIKNAIEWIKTKKFCHIYMPMMDHNSLYTTVKKVNHTMGIDVLVFDYFKGSEEGDAFDSYQELGKLTDTVKNDIAGAMDIAAIGAAQATSTGKIADSSKIKRNASTIILIQDKTPEEIESDGEECGNKKVIIVANRNGEECRPGEYIDFNFNGNKVSFKEAKQHIPQTPY